MPKKKAKKKKTSSIRKTKKTAKKAVKRQAQKPAKKRAAVQKKKAAKKTTATKSIITPAGTKTNMIVTYDPNHRATAESEVMNAFKEIKEQVKILQSEVEGLFKLQTNNARNAISKLRNLAQKKKGFFSATYHYTPIDSWTKSEIKQMQDEIKKCISGISEKDKWRLALNKRKWDTLEGTPLILKLTEVINKPNVDLDNPQKIVQVEIIGKEAGISLLKPEEKFDTQNN